MRTSVRFVRRGKPVELSGAQARMTLLDWLRLSERAVGTKEGCAEGDCGACTVILAREKGDRVVLEPVNACILLAGQADGAEVLTVEDLSAPGGPLHPVQDAMWRHHGSQCGFCTPGIVMSLAALHAQAPRPVSRAAVCDQLAGNLCRCTGYRPIIDAALEVCAEAAPVPDGGRQERLAALRDDADLFAGEDDAFFAAPRSEAVLAALLARHPDALVLAGATDAGLWITKALMEPRKVVWLGRVAGLDKIERLSSPFPSTGRGREWGGATSAVARGIPAIARGTPTPGSSPQGGGGSFIGDVGDVFSIGATATLADAARELGALAPDLAEVVRRFGSAQVRASATVGGNIANGSPIGDLAPCLIALGATLELAHGDATRTLALEDFFIGYKKQDRRPGEIVRRVLVPLPPADLAFRAYKISKRMDEDISAVLGAFAVRLDGRRIASARVAFGGMAGTPARAKTTEVELAGVDLDDRATWKPSLEALAVGFTPLDDHRASAAYRRVVARNLLVKALTELAGAPLLETRILATAEARHAAQ